MGLLDRAKTTTSPSSSTPMSGSANNSSIASNPINGKIGAKKGSYSLSQVIADNLKLQSGNNKSNYDNPAFVNDNNENNIKRPMMSESTNRIQEELHLNNVMVETTAYDRYNYNPTQQQLQKTSDSPSISTQQFHNTRLIETSNGNIGQLTNENSLPLPPSPTLVAGLLNNNSINTSNNITRISNVNSTSAVMQINDGVTSFIEKTAKMINSHDDVEFTNDTIFDPNATTAIVNNSHSLILDGNCNNSGGGGSSYEDDHVKLKTYTMSKTKAWRLKMFVWLMAIFAGACIASVALYFFVRYGYEQDLHEKIIATDIAYDAERLNSAQIIVPVSKRQMLRMSDVVELKNLVNQSFVNINKTVDSIDIYLLNETTHDVSENASLKVLIDVSLVNRNINKNDAKSINAYISPKIDNSSRFLINYKKILLNMLQSDVKAITYSESHELEIIMNDKTNDSRTYRVYTNKVETIQAIDANANDSFNKFVDVNPSLNKFQFQKPVLASNISTIIDVYVKNDTKNEAATDSSTSTQSTSSSVVMNKKLSSSTTEKSTVSTVTVTTRTISTTKTTETTYVPTSTTSSSTTPTTTGTVSVSTSIPSTASTTTPVSTTAASTTTSMVSVPKTVTVSSDKVPILTLNDEGDDILYIGFEDKKEKIITDMNLIKSSTTKSLSNDTTTVYVEPNGTSSIVHDVITSLTTFQASSTTVVTEPSLKIDTNTPQSIINSKIIVTDVTEITYNDTTVKSTVVSETSTSGATASTTINSTTTSITTPTSSTITVSTTTSGSTTTTTPTTGITKTISTSSPSTKSADTTATSTTTVSTLSTTSSHATSSSITTTTSITTFESTTKISSETTIALNETISQNLNETKLDNTTTATSSTFDNSTSAIFQTNYQAITNAKKNTNFKLLLNKLRAKLSETNGTHNGSIAKMSQLADVVNSFFNETVVSLNVTTTTTQTSVSTSTTSTIPTTTTTLSSSSIETTTTTTIASSTVEKKSIRRFKAIGDNFLKTFGMFKQRN